MDVKSKKKIAQYVKEGRLAKGYTQQQLGDMAGISLRSIQRIENAEVLPRDYTLKVLLQHLDLSWHDVLDNKTAGEAIKAHEIEPTPVPAPVVKIHRPNKAQKIILTFASGIVITSLVWAYIAQSPRFPETAFEFFLLLAGVTVFYALVLLRIWK